MCVCVCVSCDNLVLAYVFGRHQTFLSASLSIDSSNNYSECNF